MKTAGIIILKLLQFTYLACFLALLIISLADKMTSLLIPTPRSDPFVQRVCSPNPHLLYLDGPFPSRQILCHPVFPRELSRHAN